LPRSAQPLCILSQLLWWRGTEFAPVVALHLAVCQVGFLVLEMYPGSRFLKYCVPVLFVVVKIDGVSGAL